MAPMRRRPAAAGSSGRASVRKATLKRRPAVGGASEASPGGRRGGAPVLREVPTVGAASCAPEAAQAMYRRHGLLLIKDAAPTGSLPGFAALHKAFKSSPGVVQKTWWVESEGGAKLTPSQVLGPQTPRRGSYYCSFIAQGSNKCLESVLGSLPFREPAALEAVPHEACAWVFFGSNADRETPLPGRAEHTDSVEHAGTWHLQCSGRKTWLVRPLDEARLWSAAGCSRPRLGTSPDPDGHRRLEVRCEEGDLLIISTRLWWHQTRLPWAGGGASLSVARDFRWPGDTTAAGRHAAAIAASKEKSEMVNADVPYATQALEEHSRILEERPQLAVQSPESRLECLSCERCAASIGSPALHLAVLRGEVSRMEIEQGGGAATKYADWGGQVPGAMPLPVVRPIVRGTRGGGLFCSRPCEKKGRAKTSEVKDFVRRSWDFAVETPVPSFLASYVECLGASLRNGDGHRSAALLACAAFGRVAPKGDKRLAELLAEIAEDLEERVPGWKGRVLYEKIGAVQSGLEWPEPNVEVDFEHDVIASLTTTRAVTMGQFFNLEG